MERMKTRNQGVYTPKPRGRRGLTARLVRGVLNLSPLPDAGVATMLGLPKGDSSEGEDDELDKQVLADRKAQAEAAQTLGAMRGDADGDEEPESTSKPTARSSAKAVKRLRRGVRPQLLAKAMEEHLSTDECEDAMWRAALSTGFCALLRGGEIGTQSSESFDEKLHLCRSDVTFFRRNGVLVSGGRRPV